MDPPPPDRLHEVGLLLPFFLVHKDTSSGEPKTLRARDALTAKLEMLLSKWKAKQDITFEDTRFGLVKSLEAWLGG